MFKVNKMKNRTTANSMIFGGGFGTGPGKMSYSAIGGGTNRNHLDSLLQNIIPEDTQVLQAMYRDMYTYDSIAGAAVDLMSTLPFSDFKLVGGTEEQLNVFRSCVDRMNLVTMMPEISIDYLVSGAFVGTMLYNSTLKMFTDIIPYDYANCDVLASPIYGLDPIIIVKPTDVIKSFLKSDEPHFKDIRNGMDPDLLRAFQADEISLDPLNTIFLPRKTYTTSLGTSMLRRLVPLYLLEKILFRGTMTEAEKRQRSTLHIAAGSEEWEPSEEELQNLIGLFQQADLDPMGAVIATRQDITTSEIRNGGDFWKWTDVAETTSNMKLRALGINETFLSGDVNYATLETTLSVFIEHMRAYRGSVTKRMFSNKIFPIIATVNGFKKTDKTNSGDDKRRNPYTQATAAVSRSRSVDRNKFQHTMSDTTQLLIPEIVWDKQLRPESDEKYMEVLEKLEEKGVPITLRMWAASGGLDLNKIESDQPEDLATRTKLAEVMQKRQAAMSGGGGETSYEESRFIANANGHITPMQGLLKRTYSERSMEVAGESKTGKPKYILNQRGAITKMHEAAHNALVRLANDDDAYARATANARNIIRNKTLG